MHSDECKTESIVFLIRQKRYFWLHIFLILACDLSIQK